MKRKAIRALANWLARLARHPGCVGTEGRWRIEPNPDPNAPVNVLAAPWPVRVPPYRCPLISWVRETGAQG